MSGKKKDNNEKSPKKESFFVVAENRKAYHNYTVLEKIEAGIVLAGHEVKSVRNGGINLTEAYVQEHGGQIFLLGCHIVPYAHTRRIDTLPDRQKKLLLHRREIDRLAVEVKNKGKALIPVRAYFKDGKCKIEIAIAIGKKLFDKRDAIKKKEAGREIERAMKRNFKA
jgi:SsrA-binding protein